MASQSITLGGGAMSAAPGSSSVSAFRPAAAGAGPDPFDFLLPSHHPSYTMNRKYTCIIRPAQSGKTRTMQELMLEYEKFADIFHPDGENYLNIVICSKNLNLVKQTHARMQKDLFVSSDDDDGSDSASADAKIEGDIFSWMTGTKRTNITAGDLFGRIILEDVRMVICCAHKKRLEYVAELLALLDRCKSFKQRINIWMDEADDYVNLWSAPTVEFSRFNKVNDIYLVSATLDAIVQKFQRVKVRPFARTYPPCYHKTADSKIVEVESSIRDPVEYLKSVYRAHKEELCVPGARLFAPGDITVKSHDEIADFLVEEGFAVCILNGKNKCIRVPGAETPLMIAQHVPEGEIMEVGKTIAAMYRDYNLARFPFAITGKICLSRGITFQCEELRTVVAVQPDGTLTSSMELSYDFLFDFGVMPPMSDRATLYQCVSRNNGNIKDFRNYKVPTIFMSSETRNTIFGAEKIAENLATLVHTHDLADVGVEEMNWAIHGDEERYRRELEARKPGRSSAEEVDPNSYRVYDSIKVMRDVLKILGYKTQLNKPNADGFYETSLNAEKKVVSVEQVKSRLRGAYGGTTNGKRALRSMFPCYKDVHDASTLRFLIPIRPETPNDILAALDAKHPQVA